MRILVVDASRVVCDAMVAALKGRPGVEAVSQATASGEALHKAANASFDIALVSSSLPDGGSLELVRAFSQMGGASNQALKTLVVGLPESEGAILRYLEAGASGYVLREDTLEVLLQKAQAVHGGEALISPGVAAALVSRLGELANHYGGPSVGTRPSARMLTAREKEILVLLARGLHNQEIADRLTIQLGTVKNHVHNILEKLGLNSRRDSALRRIASEEVFR